MYFWLFLSDSTIRCRLVTHLKCWWNRILSIKIHLKMYVPVVFVCTHWLGVVLILCRKNIHNMSGFIFTFYMKSKCFDHSVHFALIHILVFLSTFAHSCDSICPKRWSSATGYWCLTRKRMVLVFGSFIGKSRTLGLLLLWLKTMVEMYVFILQSLFRFFHFDLWLDPFLSGAIGLSRVRMRKRSSFSVFLAELCHVFLIEYRYLELFFHTNYV